MQHDDAGSYLHVHSSFEAVGMLLPVGEICVQPLTEHVTDHIARLGLSTSGHLVLLLLVELPVLLKCCIHIVSES